MPSIVQSEISNNHIRIDINFPKEETKELLNKALKKEQKKVNLKGFRKGKAPINTIKKLYGNQILSQSIFDELNKAMSEYLQEEKIHYIGEPLPIEEDNNNDLDVKSLDDYNFAFELGLMPKEDLKGMGEEDKYLFYEIEVDSSEAEDLLDQWLRQFGTTESVENIQEDNDLLTLELMELEGGKVKDNGIEATAKILLEEISDDKLKEQFKAAVVGDEIDLNIYDLSKNGEEEFIRKHLLKIEEGQEFSPDFKAGIESVDRFNKAELNEDFFNKAFGQDNVSSKEEALEKATEAIKNQKAGRAKELLYKDVYENITEANKKMDIPEDFIKRWVSSSPSIKSETDEDIENIMVDLRNNIIRTKLLEKLEVKVEQQEILDAAYGQVYQYGIRKKEDADPIVQRMLADKGFVNQIAGNIETSKIIDGIDQHVTKEVKKLSSKEFDDIFENAVKEVQAKQKEQEEVKEE